jgi:hypothetical protein
LLYWLGAVDLKPVCWISYAVGVMVAFLHDANSYNTAESPTQHLLVQGPHSNITTHPYLLNTAILRKMMKHMRVNHKIPEFFHSV